MKRCSTCKYLQLIHPRIRQVPSYYVCGRTSKFLGDEALNVRIHMPRVCKNYRRLLVNEKEND